ncbi:MAG: endonuclease [Deltaproteobacteria bacterium]|jgi:endonuclease/exonuclease/phosphatase family metal-dependent hydrolase|nr:endonuclease [Deltaproteobacteria bacterium]
MSAKEVIPLEAPAGRPKRKRRAESKARRERAAERKDALAAAIPYLSVVRAPSVPIHGKEMGTELTVASYNVHRWAGPNGVRAPDPARAGFVISELDADIIALQEVLRPFEEDDPLERLAEALHLHLAFVATRVHRRGEIGNAILSRWPITSVFSLDLSYGRVEKRSAVAAEFNGPDGPVDIVATHLALVDRTRNRQVRMILENPRLQRHIILLGDMNAWRNCKATRALEEELVGGVAMTWPRTFPAARPVLALDRVYSRGARLEAIEAHDSPAARKASDHLPVVARIQLTDLEEEP